MVGRGYLLLTMAMALGFAYATPAAAQEDSSADEAPAEAAPVAEASAAPEGDGAAEAVAEAPDADDAPTPLPEEEPGVIKIRKAPGRAIRASEIKSRTKNLAQLIETSELRLKQLSERVMSGKAGRSGSIIVFRNEMGSSFKLIRAVFALDGAPIYSRIDESGDLGAREEIELFNGSIVPGTHKLSVSLEYRGHGYGIFSYLKGYRFKVRSSYGFKVGENKLARVRIVGYEKGDQNTPLEERPDVRYVERVEAYVSPARRGED